MDLEEYKMGLYDRMYELRVFAGDDRAVARARDWVAGTLWTDHFEIAVGRMKFFRSVRDRSGGEYYLVIKVLDNFYTVLDKSPHLYRDKIEAKQAPEWAKR